MNYDLNEEQNNIKASAHKFLEKECTSQFIRRMAEDEKGFTPELWKGMADLGWMGLMIPETHKGSGGSFLDLTVLLSEMGYFCLPGPFFSTVVLGGLTLLNAGNESQKTELLSEIAMGNCRVTMAWVEKDGINSPDGMEMSAISDGDDFVLSGSKLFVPDAHVADKIICAARTGKNSADLTLFVIDAHDSSIKVESLMTMAGDKQCEVTFDNIKVSKESIIGEINQGWPVLKKILLMAAVAKSAEMIGATKKAMDMVVPHVKEREQFGRPVGSFQAVQHHCANMLTYADTIEFMTYRAAWKIGEDLPYEQEASMAKAWVSEAARKMVALGHQVIGGMSFMEEHDLQLYFKRAKLAELMFGDGDFHREMVAEAMGL